MKENLIKSIVKQLDHFKYGKGAIEVYRDCIEYLALNIALKCDEELETSLKARYKDIFAKYTEEDRQKANEICKDIADLLACFKEKYEDYLGELYMAIIDEYGKPKLGQFFTPYHISHFMAKLNFDNLDVKSMKNIVKINEPCCGSGGMCVACLDVLNGKGVNYLTDTIVYANDIDETCVYMTYLQLSFCGASAIVEQKDTLTQKRYKTLKTLGYYIQKQYYSDKQNDTDME